MSGDKNLHGFAAASGAVDVPTTLEIWPHMIHAWPLWNAHLEPGRLALVSAGAFMLIDLDLEANAAGRSEKTGG